MMRSVLFLIGLAGLGVPCMVEARVAVPPAKPVTIPFELYKGHIYVSAFVNGKGPYRFVFDTGASGMGRADQRLVAELSLRTVGQTQNSDGVNTAPILIVRADSLRLGSVEKRNLQLLSRDYNLHRKPGEAPVMGIIGRDFFKDRLLTIDYPARTLRFNGGQLRASDRGVVAYKSNFTIPVCFTIGCYDGEVDSGSSQSLVIPKAIVSKISASLPIRAGSGTSANTTYEFYEMTLSEPVRIAGVTATRQKVIYAEPSSDKINIGSDFLKDYVLTIDQRHRLLRINR